MNLHIVPDNVFINKFFDNLKELNLTDRNMIVVRTNDTQLKFIKHDLPFAPLYSSKFRSIVGDTGKYEKVFIHLLTPLMYRWIAQNNFQQLNWAIWGADLYNLPSVNFSLYNKLTARFADRYWSFQNLLYLIKVAVTNARYRDRAYTKIDNVLTWMDSEYAFAHHHLKTLNAHHQFFFYENQTSYQKLDEVLGNAERQANKKPKVIVGNSATPTLNHLDVVHYFQSNRIQADIIIPVSYGDKKYADFLKANISFYTQGSVTFIDEYMGFEAYLRFLHSADGIVMYNKRPQGYGNILMMLYMGKPVFFNPENISLPDLRHHGMLFHDLHDFENVMKGQFNYNGNRVIIENVLSHQRLLEAYRKLF